MSIEQIYADVNSERITFGPHLIQRMYESGISIEQVLDVILTGTIRKKEPDERTRGKFTKYTISKSVAVICQVNHCDSEGLPTSIYYYRQ